MPEPKLRVEIVRQMVAQLQLPRRRIDRLIELLYLAAVPHPL